MDWLTPFLIPGASIITAALTLFGVLWVNSRSKPVETKDKWAEMRELRDDVTEVRAGWDAYRATTEKTIALLRRNIRLLHAGFHALLESYNKESRDISQWDKDAIERARAVEIDADLLN